METSLSRPETARSSQGQAVRVGRQPRPSLRPFVLRLWAIDEHGGSLRVSGAREHALPTSGMHLVFRLSDEPLRLFDSPRDIRGRHVGLNLVGGAHSTYYVKDVSTPARSVGALLRPGAARLLFGATAEELAERHTPLEDLWRPMEVELARERLLNAGGPDRQLEVLESLLACRLPQVSGLHPGVAEALERFDALESVGEAVRRSGYSHRHFVSLFRTAVGLPPKVYSRILRFKRVLRRGVEGGPLSLAALALETGYSDQAHLTREFRQLAGTTPTFYRSVAPPSPHHLPAPPGTGGQKPSRR